MWIIRHGQSTWNARDLVQGHAPGPVLTRRGRQEARAVARTLRGTPVSTLVSSDLERAVQTARPIARALGLPLRTDPRLRERALGDAEGRPVALLTSGRSGIVNGHVADADAAPAGGESIRRFYQRVTSFVAELAELAGETEPVLVTHGGVVRVLFAWTAGAGPDGMAWGPVANGRALWRPMPPLELRRRFRGRCGPAEGPDDLCEAPAEVPIGAGTAAPAEQFAHTRADTRAEMEVPQ